MHMTQVWPSCPKKQSFQKLELGAGWGGLLFLIGDFLVSEVHIYFLFVYR